jgi:hypothetical protein
LIVNQTERIVNSLGIKVVDEQEYKKLKRDQNDTNEPKDDTLSTDKKDAKNDNSSEKQTSQTRVGDDLDGGNTFGNPPNSQTSKKSFSKVEMNQFEEIIESSIEVAKLYGECALVMKDNKLITGNVIERKKDTNKLVFNKSDWLTQNFTIDTTENKFSLKYKDNKLDKIEVDEKDCIIFKARKNGIGDIA